MHNWVLLGKNARTKTEDSSSTIALMAPVRLVKSTGNLVGQSQTRTEKSPLIDCNSFYETPFSSSTITLARCFSIKQLNGDSCRYW
ncbi:uncharacterized protein DS421_15g502160 [Arachis hypogaea]|nr:uncharacterized protein DS421_15g502160 [Arachis hypogaea]